MSESAPTPRRERVIVGMSGGVGWGRIQT
ncbi:hypothetical protein, partial [Pseudomonas aeruginosa]